MAIPSNKYVLPVSFQLRPLLCLIFILQLACHQGWAPHKGGAAHLPSKVIWKVEVQYEVRSSNRRNASRQMRPLHVHIIHADTPKMSNVIRQFLNRVVMYSGKYCTASSILNWTRT